MAKKEKCEEEGGEEKKKLSIFAWESKVDFFKTICFQCLKNEM